MFLPKQTRSGLRGLAITLTTASFCLSANATDNSPKLGQAVDQKALAAIDISIGPDGVGLPAGSGNAKQGEAVYASKCAACHGPDAKGGKGLADPLVGGIGSLGSAKPVKTVGSFWPYATTLFDYTRRAMPLDAPASLSNDDVYAVSAYLLKLNGIIDDSVTLDAKNLAAIEMPNRDGFVSEWLLE